MKPLKIGFLYGGNYTTLPWGSVITMYYLAKAFERLGHIVWLYSVTDKNIIDKSLIKGTNFIISEGVPHYQIPEEIWAATEVRIFWWLSNLFFDTKSIYNSEFTGIATNSSLCYLELRSATIPMAKIDLCADESLALAKINKRLYWNECVYLGLFPHKTIGQMQLFFTSASYSLGIWGLGWDKSPYANYHRGILPFEEIGALYRSSDVAFLLTENRQKANGMINNRTFEIFAAGCPIISDKFEYLENSDFGEFISFADSAEEVDDCIKRIKRETDTFRSKCKRVQRLVLEKHNYSARAIQFYDFYTELIS